MPINPILFPLLSDMGDADKWVLNSFLFFFLFVILPIKNPLLFICFSTDSYSDLSLYKS